MHSLPLSTYCLLCSVQGGESPWQRAENILVIFGCVHCSAFGGGAENWALAGLCFFPIPAHGWWGSQPSVPSRLRAGRWDSLLHLFCVILGSSFSEKKISVRN